MAMEMLSTPECVKLALRKLEDLQTSEAAALSGATALSKVSDNLQRIHKKLLQIDRVMMNGQANWENPNDAKIVNCIQELEGVSKRTETAILTFMNEVESIKLAHIPPKFTLIDPKPVDFLALHKLKSYIKEIQSTMRKINIEDLSEPNERTDVPQPARQSIPNFDKIWFLGLEMYWKCILSKALDQTLDTRCTLEVVGTEMFAKTALEEKIFQSAEVKAHFEVCFWLFPRIGTYKFNLFRPIDILRKMLLKLGVTISSDACDGDYQRMSALRQSLKEKRFLVIVDNKWPELWTLLNAVFPEGNNGSRVLRTSEKQGYSDYVYELPTINYQHCLNFLTKELGNNTIPEFEEYSDFFGVDLPKDFVFFSNLSRSDDIKGYSALPSVLKMCFSYTAAVFPCGSMIHAESLIRLWIVEGFIPHEEGRTMENVAESYLDQFVQRGLLRISGVYYHNQSNCCVRSILLQSSLHNNLNPTSEQFDKNVPLPVTVITSLDNSDHDKSSTDLHRLAVYLPYQSNHTSSFITGSELQNFDCPNLHSLFFFGSVARVSSSHYTFLRVLAVFSSHIQFPEEHTACWLDMLINLRYLGFIVCLVEGRSLATTLGFLGKLELLDLSESIVVGLSEFIKNNKRVKVVGPAKEESHECWFPVPDMYQ